MTDKDIKDYCKNCDVEPPAMRFKCPECEHNPDKENFAKDINVPHKERIIIDGVDVKNCKGIDLSLSPLVKCKFLKFKTSSGGIAGIWCSDHTNCYFKQLARKTQECEKLKEQLMQKDEVNTFFNTPIKGWSDDPCEICPCKNELQLAEQLIAGILKTLNLEAYDWRADQNEILTEIRTFEVKYEALTLENQEGYEIVDELKQECEELKEKNQKLEMQLCNDCGERDDYNIPCKMIRDLDYGLQKEIEENDRYRKALEEIDKVWEKDKDGDYDFVKQQIFNIINKAKEVNNENT